MALVINTLETYNLYKKINLNQMTHAFIKVVLNLRCNKHGKYYVEKVQVIRALTLSGASVNFTGKT